MSTYTATHIVEEAPYVPTHGEFRLVSGENPKAWIPMSVSGLDEDGGDYKYIISGYTDYSGVATAIGVTTQSMFLSGYLDYDVYGIVDGIGGYARDISLAIQGGPVPLLNFTTGVSVINAVVAPHPSGFQAWSAGKSILGRVKEHGVATGEQCLVYLEPSDANTNLTTVEELDDVGDVAITSATEGDTIVYDGSDWVNTGLQLKTLSDIGWTDTPSDNDIMYYSGSDWEHAALTLDLVSGMTITSAAEKDVLIYTSDVWVNSPLVLSLISGMNVEGAALGDKILASGEEWFLAKTLTELTTGLTEELGADPIFELSNPPVNIYGVHVFTGGAYEGALAPGDPTADSYTYELTGLTGIKVRNEDDITGLIVTYDYLSLA